MEGIKAANLKKYFLEKGSHGKRSLLDSSWTGRTETESQGPVTLGLQQCPSSPPNKWVSRRRSLWIDH